MSADLAQTVYYAGFTVFTLGVGDFVAASDPWRVLTSVATFSGLFLITLAITYLVSVVSAVVGRRALALQVHAFGETADEIVSRAWTGAAFSSAFIQQLLPLAKQLVTLAEQHLAYPVLHYFHSGRRQTSAPVAIAVLDDAMLLLGAAVVPQARPDHVVLGYVRYAIGRSLATTAVSTARGVSAPPPAPELDRLAEAGVPLVSRSEFADAVAAESQRRMALLRLVGNDGWPWR